MKITATIAHPNLPGVVVFVHKSQRVDHRRVKEILSNHRIPVAILDPTTNLPCINEKGELQYAWRLTESDAVNFAPLAVSLDGWQKVTDAEGNEVPFNARNVPTLAEEHLDVTLPGAGDEPAKMQPFSYYITELVSQGDIFNVDPTAPASSTS
jgi:hypothetical protein